MESEGLKTQKASPAHKPPLAVSAVSQWLSGQGCSPL